MTGATTPRRATIATRVYEPEAAAAAYRLGNLTRALERLGYRVTVLTTKSPGARRSSTRVRRWPVLRDRSGAVRGYLQYLSFDVPLLFRLLFGPRADVVVAEPPPTTGVVTRIACAMRRVPYVYFSADVMSSALTAVKVSGIVRRAVTAMERWALRGAAEILAISDGVRNELEQLGTDPAKISVIGTGIDTALFSPDGEAEDAEPPYFLYAGTMSEFQGAAVFVDAFELVAAEHPDARLVMFGGGVDIDLLTAKAAPLGNRVAFPGFVDAEVVARWTRGATASLASVRPGQGYDFAFPTKTLASVSCGTPVVFAGVGPLRELVTDHNLGWSVDWDARQVAGAMLDALRAPRRRLGRSTLDWLDANYSLRGAADRGAAAVDAVVGLRSTVPSDN
nr:glycosyltransferase family 4 protein [Terrimesophilobacter mesophilus]